jgi:hypothetical protein
MGCPDGFCRVVHVVCQVAVAGEDVGSYLAIAAHACELPRAGEVIPGAFVMPGVMGHPPGHVAERGRGSEDGRAAVGEQSRGDLVRQVAQYEWIEVAAFVPEVGYPERADRHRVIVVSDTGLYAG